MTFVQILEMKFKHFNFIDGINYTVRYGVEWSKVLSPTDRIYLRRVEKSDQLFLAVVRSITVCQFQNIMPAILAAHHNRVKSLEQLHAELTKYDRRFERIVLSNQSDENLVTCIGFELCDSAGQSL